MTSFTSSSVDSSSCSGFSPLNSMDKEVSTSSNYNNNNNLSDTSASNLISIVSIPIISETNPPSSVASPDISESTSSSSAISIPSLPTKSDSNSDSNSNPVSSSISTVSLPIISDSNSNPISRSNSTFTPSFTPSSHVKEESVKFTKVDVKSILTTGYTYYNTRVNPEKFGFAKAVKFTDIIYSYFLFGDTFSFYEFLFKKIQNNTKNSQKTEELLNFVFDITFNRKGGVLIPVEDLVEPRTAELIIKIGQYMKSYFKNVERPVAPNNTASNTVISELNLGSLFLAEFFDLLQLLNESREILIKTPEIEVKKYYELCSTDKISLQDLGHKTKKNCIMTKLGIESKIESIHFYFDKGLIKTEETKVKKVEDMTSKTQKTEPAVKNPRRKNSYLKIIKVGENFYRRICSFDTLNQNSNEIICLSFEKTNPETRKLILVDQIKKNKKKLINKHLEEIEVVFKRGRGIANILINEENVELLEKNLKKIGTNEASKKKEAKIEKIKNEILIGVEKNKEYESQIGQFKVEKIRIPEEINNLIKELDNAINQLKNKLDNTINHLKKQKLEVIKQANELLKNENKELDNLIDAWDTKAQEELSKNIIDWKKGNKEFRTEMDAWSVKAQADLSKKILEWKHKKLSADEEKAQKELSTKIVELCKKVVELKNENTENSEFRTELENWNIKFDEKLQEKLERKKEKIKQKTDALNKKVEDLQNKESVISTKKRVIKKPKILSNNELKKDNQKLIDLSKQALENEAQETKEDVKNDLNKEASIKNELNQKRKDFRLLAYSYRYQQKREEKELIEILFNNRDSNKDSNSVSLPISNDPLRLSNIVKNFIKTPLEELSKKFKNRKEKSDFKEIIGPVSNDITFIYKLILGCCVPSDLFPVGKSKKEREFLKQTEKFSLYIRSLLNSYFPKCQSTEDQAKVLLFIYLLLEDLMTYPNYMGANVVYAVVDQMKDKSILEYFNNFFEDKESLLLPYEKLFGVNNDVKIAFVNLQTDHVQQGKSCIPVTSLFAGNIEKILEPLLMQNLITKEEEKGGSRISISDGKSEHSSENSVQSQPIIKKKDDKIKPSQDNISIFHMEQIEKAVKTMFTSATGLKVEKLKTHLVEDFFHLIHNPRTNLYKSLQSIRQLNVDKVLEEFNQRNEYLGLDEQQTTGNQNPSLGETANSTFKTHLEELITCFKSEHEIKSLQILNLALKQAVRIPFNEYENVQLKHLNSTELNCLATLVKLLRSPIKSLIQHQLDSKLGDEEFELGYINDLIRRINGKDKNKIGFKSLEEPTEQIKMAVAFFKDYDRKKLKQIVELIFIKIAYYSKEDDDEKLNPEERELLNTILKTDKDVIKNIFLIFEMIDIYFGTNDEFGFIANAYKSTFTVFEENPYMQQFLIALIEALELLQTSEMFGKFKSLSRTKDNFDHFVNYKVKLLAKLFS